MILNAIFVTLGVDDGSCMDKYMLQGQICVSDAALTPDGYSQMYREVTLSGCKSLCTNVHDLTCTQIVYLPKSRSCVLMSPRYLTPVSRQQDCLHVVEIYRRQRCLGESKTYKTPPAY